MTNRVTCLTNPDTLMTEAQSIVRSAATPVHPGELVKGQIRRAATKLRLSPRRAECLWYGRAARLLAQELEALRHYRATALAEQRARLLAELAAMDAQQTQLELQLRDEWNAA